MSIVSENSVALAAKFSIPESIQPSRFFCVFTQFYRVGRPATGERQAVCSIFLRKYAFFGSRRPCQPPARMSVRSLGCRRLPRDVSACPGSSASSCFHLLYGSCCLRFILPSILQAPAPRWRRQLPLCGPSFRSRHSGRRILSVRFARGRHPRLPARACPCPS